MVGPLIWPSTRPMPGDAFRPDSRIRASHPVWRVNVFVAVCIEVRCAPTAAAIIIKILAQA